MGLVGGLSIGANPNPLKLPEPPELEITKLFLSITGKRQQMERHFELMGFVMSHQLQMRQNIQWICIKICRLKLVRHMCGLSPTICGLFLVFCVIY